MRKTKSDALWNNLSSDQQKTLDSWLFEEKLGHVEVLPRAQKELGFKGRASSLKRYYAKRRKERTVVEFTELRDRVAEISGAPGDANALRGASMKLLNAYLFQQVREAPDDVDKWGPVANLIVDNDHNEALRELKGEEHRLRREAMRFAREKFQFDTMRRALKALPQLLALAEAQKDPNLKRYEENAYWNELRRAMYGPGRKVHPESPEEEAEMLAAKRERATAAGEELEPEEEERIIDAQPPTPSSPYYAEYMEEKAKKEGTYENIQQPTSNAEHSIPEKLQNPNAEQEKEGEA